MSDISLIPKDYKEKKIGSETIFSKIGIFVFVLVALSLLIYGGLFFYNKSLGAQIIELQTQIKEAKKQRDVDFEKEAIPLERALRGLKTILKNHFYWSNVFSKFEKLIVPQISFSDFNGTIEKDGSVNLSLSGKTAGYTYLAKQMVSFSQEELVSDIKVSGIKLGTEGGIEFGLNISFKKDILLK